MLFIIGLSSFILSKASSHEAESKFEDYNDAVQTWNNTLREQFNQIDIQVYLDNNPTILTQPLKQSESEPKINFQDLRNDPYFDINTYQPLFYEDEFPANTLLNQTEYQFDSSKIITFGLAISNTSYTSLPHLPLFKKQLHKGVTSKACFEHFKGYYNSIKKRCISYWVTFT